MHRGQLDTGRYSDRPMQARYGLENKQLQQSAAATMSPVCCVTTANKLRRCRCRRRRRDGSQTASESHVPFLAAVSGLGHLTHGQVTEELSQRTRPQSRAAGMQYRSPHLQSAVCSLSLSLQLCASPGGSSAKHLHAGGLFRTRPAAQAPSVSLIHCSSPSVTQRSQPNSPRCHLRRASISGKLPVSAPPSIPSYSLH